MSKKKPTKNQTAAQRNKANKSLKKMQKALEAQLKTNASDVEARKNQINAAAEGLAKRYLDKGIRSASKAMAARDADIQNMKIQHAKTPAARSDDGVTFSDVRDIINRRFPHWDFNSEYLEMILADRYEEWIQSQSNSINYAASKLEEYADRALENRDMKTANTLYEEVNVLRQYIKERNKGYKVKRI